MKAAALRAVLTNMPGIGYVGSSGPAGYGDNNAIRSQKSMIMFILWETELRLPGQGMALWPQERELPPITRQTRYCVSCLERIRI